MSYVGDVIAKIIRGASGSISVGALQLLDDKVAPIHAVAGPDGDLLVSDTTMIDPNGPFILSAVGQTADFDVRRANSITFVIKPSSDLSGGALAVWGSEDGQNWRDISRFAFTYGSSSGSHLFFSSSTSSSTLDCASFVSVKITVAAISAGSWSIVPILHTAPGPRPQLVVGAESRDQASIMPPVKIGGLAASGVANNVSASGDLVDLMATMDGKLVVHPYAAPGACWKYTAGVGGITNTSEITLVAAGGAAKYQVLGGIAVHNVSVVPSEFAILDSSGGTAVYRGYAPASMPAPAVVQFGGALRSLANSPLQVAMATTATQTYVNAWGWTSS